LHPTCDQVRLRFSLPSCCEWSRQQLMHTGLCCALLRTTAPAAPHLRSSPLSQMASPPQGMPALPVLMMSQTELSPDELHLRHWQKQRDRQIIHAHATGLVRLSADTALPLFTERNAGESFDPIQPLVTSPLKEEWFVDLPNLLQCPVCTEVVQNPPNLETCGTKMRSAGATR
jgi:hypothetical protein